MIGLVGAAILSFVGLELLILSGAHSELKRKPDVVVFLGAKIWDENPSPVLRCRLDTGIEYLKQLEEEGHKPIIVVTGGKGSDEIISEAMCMKNYLTEHGIEAERIYEEDQAVNTATNLRYTEALLKELGCEELHWCFVSNGFHLTRVRMLADRFDIDHSTLMAPMPEWTSRVYSTVREAFALVKSFILDR